MRRLWRSDYPLPPAQWAMTRFSNGCAATGFDCFEGSRQAARLFFGYSVVISAPSRGLTQTVTQTRKRPGSIGRTQWITHRAESTQKRRKALVSNAFRRSSYLITQEVTGSSPAVSTNKYPPAKPGVFLMRAKPYVASYAACGVSTTCHLHRLSYPHRYKSGTFSFLYSRHS